MGLKLKWNIVTEIKKKRQIFLYKKFCTRPSLRCHHLYKFCEERKRAIKHHCNNKKGQLKIGTKYFKWTKTHLHNWPDHLHQCLLLESFHPPPHLLISPPGLSSHGAAQQHWYIRSRPEQKEQQSVKMKSRNVTSKTLITGELNSTFLQKPYLIKNTESFSDLLLAVCVLHLSCHHGQELRKVYSSITWLKSKVHSQISEFWFVIMVSSHMQIGPYSQKLTCWWLM